MSAFFARGTCHWQWAQYQAKGHLLADFLLYAGFQSYGFVGLIHSLHIGGNGESLYSYLVSVIAGMFGFDGYDPHRKFGFDGYDPLIGTWLLKGMFQPMELGFWWV